MLHQSMYGAILGDIIGSPYEFTGSPKSKDFAFLESTSFEDTISLGGDADTMGAITGSIAWSHDRFQRKTGISAQMAKLWSKAADYLPEDWLDFIIQFDSLCRNREEQYQRTGHTEPFLLI